MAASERERPGERRAAARTGVVWAALRSVLEAAGPGDVLDIGGGTGGFAVGVAELGHRVRVVDPSPDALASLDRRAREHGVADQIVAQQGELSSLGELVEPGSVDVVLCHGVLEVVDDAAAALATLAEVLRPGGTLSLLVSQRHAAVIARAMAGQFQQARALLGPAHDSSSRGVGRRFTAAEITGLLVDAGFTVTTTHGIRVFADLVPGSLVDSNQSGPGAAEALAELEQAVAERPEYQPLATQLHLIATR